MRTKLNEEYRQWRIVITPQEMVLKLENLEGEVVVNDTIPTGEDWGWVLDNCISFMAQPIEKECLVAGNTAQPSITMGMTASW